jgi:hypothetical protein
MTEVTLLLIIRILLLLNKILSLFGLVLDSDDGGSLERTNFNEQITMTLTCVNEETIAFRIALTPLH